MSSAPSGSPSSKNCTPATPMLSEAVAVTEMDPLTVDPSKGLVTVAVGGVVSGTLVVNETGAASLPRIFE